MAKRTKQRNSEEWEGEVTAPISMEWDPDEISQVAKVEELDGNPLAPVVRGLNDIGRSAQRLDQPSEVWANSLGRLMSLLANMQ